MARRAKNNLKNDALFLPWMTLQLRLFLRYSPITPYPSPPPPSPPRLLPCFLGRVLSHCHLFVLLCRCHTQMLWLGDKGERRDTSRPGPRENDPGRPGWIERDAWSSSGNERRPTEGNQFTPDSSNNMSSPPLSRYRPAVTGRILLLLQEMQSAHTTLFLLLLYLPPCFPLPTSHTQIRYISLRLRLHHFSWKLLFITRATLKGCSYKRHSPWFNCGPQYPHINHLSLHGPWKAKAYES